jgi:hypothetical protein
MRTEQSFTGLGLENKVLLVLGWRTKFYWSWAGGPVLIVRTGFSLYFKCTSTSLFTDVILKFEHFFV